jgi:hypothetical protein
MRIKRNAEEVGVVTVRRRLKENISTIRVADRSQTIIGGPITGAPTAEYLIYRSRRIPKPGELIK